MVPLLVWLAVFSLFPHTDAQCSAKSCLEMRYCMVAEPAIFQINYGRVERSLRCPGLVTVTFSEDKGRWTLDIIETQNIPGDTYKFTLSIDSMKVDSNTEVLQFNKKGKPIERIPMKLESSQGKQMRMWRTTIDNSLMNDVDFDQVPTFRLTNYKNIYLCHRKDLEFDGFCPAQKVQVYEATHRTFMAALMKQGYAKPQCTIDQVEDNCGPELSDCQKIDVLRHKLECSEKLWIKSEKKYWLESAPRWYSVWNHTCVHSRWSVSYELGQIIGHHEQKLQLLCTSEREMRAIERKMRQAESEMPTPKEGKGKVKTDGDDECTLEQIKDDCPITDYCSQIQFKKTRLLCGSVLWLRNADDEKVWSVVDQAYCRNYKWRFRRNGKSTMSIDDSSKPVLQCSDSVPLCPEELDVVLYILLGYCIIMTIGIFILLPVFYRSMREPEESMSSELSDFERTEETSCRGRISLVK